MATCGHIDLMICRLKLYQKLCMQMQIIYSSYMTVLLFVMFGIKVNKINDLIIVKFR